MNLKRFSFFIFFIFSLSTLSYAIDSSSNVVIGAQVCVPEYNYSDWSPCLDGVQYRTITDTNSCFDKKTENRICKISNNETENKFLNSKFLTITKDSNSKRTYLATLESSYNEIFKTNEKIISNTFLLVDERNGEEYLSSFVKEENNTFYYSLERVEQSTFPKLESEGLISIENKNENTLFNFLLVLVILISFLLFSFFIIQKMKNEK